MLRVGMKFSASAPGPGSKILDSLGFRGACRNLLTTLDIEWPAPDESCFAILGSCLLAAAHVLKMELLNDLVQASGVAG